MILFVLSNTIIRFKVLGRKIMCNLKSWGICLINEKGFEAQKLLPPYFLGIRLASLIFLTQLTFPALKEEKATQTNPAKG